MKCLVLGLCVLVLCGSVYGRVQQRFPEDVEDNEFAEFEEFEEEPSTSSSPSSSKETPQSQGKSSQQHVVEDEDSSNQMQDAFDADSDMDAIVEDEDSEFDHLQDEEEFEGFDGDKVAFSNKMDDKDGPKITIAKVPLHFRSNWDSFYLEILMLAGLVVYFINFFTGKAKNSKMANVWYSTHKQLLDENFSLVGDDGKMEIENRGLMKESEHLYTLWCSGRTCCEGMLVELKLIKRQDLVAVIAQMMRPVQDQIHIKVEMSKDEMDSIVFCVASKKTALRLVKDMNDLSTFSSERRSGEKFGLPSQFVVMSEMSETASAMMDSRVVSFINKYANIIDYIHFSDQYSGPKQQEETSLTKLPPTKKMLLFGLNVPVKGRSVSDAMESLKPLMSLVFYCMEKVKRFKLSKEARTKADKNRARVEEAFLKNTHAARAEAAALRREEKRRQEKERILQEDDPEKQRKWEEKELKRQMKKKGPKMKQLKVKAL